MLKTDLLRPKDAARMLAISERHLWGLTQEGKIPACRLGRSVRYDRADLEGFVEASKNKGGVK